MNSDGVRNGGGQGGPAGSSPPGRDEASSLSVKDVTKVFRAADGSAVVALDHVSLAVAPGEMVSLIGQSGCGKSTLLRLIAGLDRPTSGELRVGNEPITAPSAERGMMFQSANLFPWLTVRRNIESGLVARGVLRQRRHEVDEFMRLVGLEAFANVYPHELSGGMAQRVALARALVNHPKVLLLDEPLGALDQFTRMRMQDEICDLWQSRGTTMVLVTHYVDEAIYMSDRIVVMTPRPGRFARIIAVPLARPRDRNSPEFVELRGEILEMLHFAGKDAATHKDRPTSPGVSVPEGTGQKDTAAEASAAVRTAAGSGGGLDADVIIIGGGPAGSTLGAYLTKAGVSHLILERAQHPRRHVGESLVCSTTPLFQEIGFLPVMEREGFVRKHGASWSHWSEEVQHDIRFREVPELGIIQNYTYHVDRARFDQLLLEHAQSCGSRVLQGVHVEGVEFGPDGAAKGVTVQQGGARRTLRCRVVADASGRNTVLGAQLKLKQKDPLFNQFAVHGWFEGVDRGGSETADFIHVHVLPGAWSWAWQIPISPTVTSVGVITEQSDFVKAGESVEDYFARQVARNPVLARRMAGARRVHGFYREGNYSYVMERFVGNGWLLVGDAARFVDPVFSSGVSVAMESAKRAAAAIVEALAHNDVRAERFASYETALRAGIDVWRDFILLYYRLPPLFLDLIKEPGALPQLVRLLQGDVYDRRSVPILEQMREQIAAVEADPRHRWKPYLCPVGAGAQ
jgi:ABC-type nitrate/sulfonate/bicarbonate transport system ATPase subunit/flavin-dependent dehydrogenase